jgi:ParB family chromosome partitioning protein
MVAPPKALGRGLQSLLGAEPTVSASRGGGTLPIALMQAGPFQPRREIHQQPLEDLAASLKANGVIEPIIVRALPAGTAGTARYQIVAGERRWRAARLAGLTDIPTIVRQITDQQAVAIALIENIQREDLTAAEEARALRRLPDWQMREQAPTNTRAGTQMSRRLRSNGALPVTTCSTRPSERFYRYVTLFGITRP